MHMLFAISVASFCTALWVALSFMRRVKLYRTRRTGPAPRRRRWQTQEFFEAGDFRTPRRLRLSQDLANMGTRNTRALAVTSRTLADPPLAPAGTADFCPPGTFLAPYRFPVTSSPAPSISAPGEASPLHATAHSVAPRQNVISISNSAPLPPTQSKAPRPVRPHSMRFDLSRFGKNHGDLGDLSDPYTNLLRGSGTLGPTLKRT